jgi:flagellar protein FliO/FliZ
VTYYILKLVIMLPLMAGMIVGALWLYRKYQPGLATGVKQRDMRLVETLSMGTSGRLAVIEFGSQRILLSATRGKIEQIAAREMTEAERSGLGTPLQNDDPDAGLGEPANPFRTIMNRALAHRAADRQGQD